MPREGSDGARARPRLGRRRLLIGAAAAGLLLAAPPLASWRRLPPVKAFAFFDTLGLMRSTGRGTAEPGWVRKWTRPVAVRVYGAPESHDLAELGRILAKLAPWTGLSFRVVGRNFAGGATVGVHFVSADAMKRRYDGPVCHCATYGNGGRLHTGVIEVAEGHSDCLRHEFMHALGFDNHWTGAQATEDMPSVLAYRYAVARSDDFSLCDELAVRILYDPRLAPGMPRAKALPVVRTVLDEVLEI